jgi:membrane-associated phospholipid phosphatase
MDYQLFRWFHVDLHREWLDPLFWLISSSGLGWVLAVALALLLKWKSTRMFVLPLATSLAFASIASPVMKALIPRNRPSQLLEASPQETFFLSSFPSGHTTAAFAVGVTLYLITRKSDKAWAGGLAMAWACLVGLSRMYRGVHWPTDVVAGALLGTTCATLAFLLLSALGHWLHLESPGATLTGQEAALASESEAPAES